MSIWFKAIMRVDYYLESSPTFCRLKSGMSGLYTIFMFTLFTLFMGSVALDESVAYD